MVTAASSLLHLQQNGPSHVDIPPPPPRHIRYTKIVRDDHSYDPLKHVSYRCHHHLCGQARSVNRGEDLHLEYRLTHLID